MRAGLIFTLLIVAAAAAGADERPNATAGAGLPAAKWNKASATYAGWTNAAWRLEGPTAAAGLPAGKVKPAKKTGRDLWFGKDKADHFVVSAFLTGFGYYAARKETHYSDPAGKNIGAGFSLSLGLLKELRDQRRRGGIFSLKDLGADILGTGIGYLLCSIGKS